MNINIRFVSCLMTVILLCIGCTDQQFCKFNQYYPMQPAIYPSDWLVYQEQSIYDYGDILLFQAYKNERGLYAFRIVGLPGDSIAMDQFVCIINGKKSKYRVLSEDVVFDSSGGERNAMEAEEVLPNGVKVRLYIEKEYRQEHIISSFDPQIVPPGHYFLLGDTRTLASDSRYQGAIPFERITGKVTNVIHMGEKK